MRNEKRNIFEWVVSGGKFEKVGIGGYFGRGKKGMVVEVDLKIEKGLRGDVGRGGVMKVKEVRMWGK
jgi:hypothetical protein